jgi:uncharacterized protein involved in exopolysaccharide biosynthesis
MNDMKDSVDTLQSVSAMHDTTHSQESRVLDVLVTLGEQKRLILSTAVAGALIGLVVSLMLPPSYTGKTVMMPPQQQKGGLTSIPGLDALADLGGAIGMKTPEEMYVGLLQSDAVADDLVKRFNLKTRYGEELLSDAREKLARHVKISSDKKTGFITIEASDKSPEFAAQLANGYVDGLTRQLGRLALTEAQQRRVFFQREVDKTLIQLSQAEATFDHARQKSGVISLDGQVTSTIRASADLRARIAAREVQIQAMRTYATDQNPDVQRALAEVSAMQQQLARLEQGGGTARNGAEGSGNASSVDSDAAALANIRAYREVKYQEAMLDQFRKQLELAKMDEAKEGPLVQQVDAATPPERKSAPKRLLIVAISFVLGLAVGICAGLYKAALRANRNLSFQMARLRDAWRLRSLTNGVK